MGDLSAALPLATAAVAAGAAIDVDRVVVDPVELRHERERHRGADRDRRVREGADEHARRVGPGTYTVNQPRGVPRSSLTSARNVPRMSRFVWPVRASVGMPARPSVRTNWPVCSVPADDVIVSRMPSVVQDGETSTSGGAAASLLVRATTVARSVMRSTAIGASSAYATKRPKAPPSMRPDDAPGIRSIVRPPWTRCAANVAAGSIGGTSCVS